MYTTFTTYSIFLSLLLVCKLHGYVYRVPFAHFTNREFSTSTSLKSNSGAAVEVKNVYISIGNNDIMSDVNWVVMPGERWAVVGPNGAGKSTLLKAITKTGGETLSVREGEIALSPKLRLGYLEQKGVSGSTLSVREEVTSRMDSYSNAKARLEAAELALSNGDTSDETLTSFEEAMSDFEAAGGYNVEQKIANVLKGLGFMESDYDKLCSEFSGGWQMRIALARLLLNEPDILVLDEPTNHLDKGAKAWISNYLRSYQKTLLVVSHDVNLLKTAVSSIAEVRDGVVDFYKSRSYDQWLVEREEREKAIKAEYESNQREIDRLQTFVDRFGAKTMGASLAQSRLKSIEKIEEKMQSNAPIKIDRSPPYLNLPKAPRGSHMLMQIINGDISWMKANGESVPILSGINIKFERGMRICVRGPNGAGKSTLLGVLSNKLQLNSGERILGDGLEMGVFTQDLAQDLDPNLSAINIVLQNVRKKDPTISDEKVRSVLGGLGLKQEKALRLASVLSGGEKARVALGSFSLIPANLLLLDEPSNHLDIETLKVLTKALRNFDGTSLVISHDKLFLEELDPTHVITVRNGKVSMEERGLRESDWDDDLYSRTCVNEEELTTTQEKIVPTASSSKTVLNTTTSTSSNTKKKTTTSMPSTSKTNTNKNSDQNQFKKVSKIESNIAKYEKELAIIESDMNKNEFDVEKLMTLQKNKDSLQNKIDKLYADLVELEV